MLVISVIGYVGIYTYAKIKPKISIEPVNSYYIYDSNNDLYSNNKLNDWVSLENISKHLINATISVEDKNFFNHRGFDYPRILKALYINTINKKTLQGASTISQQYTKNLFLEFDKTWKRKIEEAWLTIQLETHYSKEEILEGYLNTINYGGVFGIENASKYYFDKSSKDLTLAEASILAGIPKYPSKYSPIVNEENAKQRQLIILNSMVKNKYISEQEKDEAYNTVLEYKGSLENNDLTTLMYYQDAVINELKTIETIPKSLIDTGGLKIYTNLDINAQTILDTNIKNNINNESDLEVASVVMEPTTGKVLALAGGKNYSKSQYNRAISSKRQVGSTIKPFLYYSALENGFTPSTTFTSEKTTFVFGENKTYSPQNYADKYPNKKISLATAIAYSDNIYAVKTHLFLGEETLSEMAARVGINDNLDKLPSTILGTIGTNIMDMMQGYSVLANEGNKIKPYFITKVEDFNGNILYEHKTQVETVLNKSVVYVLNELLSNCYASELIEYGYPTCISMAPKITKKYAIKTGTTDTDYLVFGYNKDLIVGTWVGYDDNRDINNDDNKVGKNIWVDTIEAYLKDKDNNWYETPQNVVGVLVNPITGEAITTDTNSSNKKILYYLKGTEPYEENQKLDELVPTTKYQEENVSQQ